MPIKYIEGGVADHGWLNMCADELCDCPKLTSFSHRTSAISMTTHSSRSAEPTELQQGKIQRDLLRTTHSEPCTPKDKMVPARNTRKSKPPSPHSGGGRQQWGIGWSSRYALGLSGYSIQVSDLYCPAPWLGSSWYESSGHRRFLQIKGLGPPVGLPGRVWVMDGQNGDLASQGSPHPPTASLYYRDCSVCPDWHSKRPCCPYHISWTSFQGALAPHMATPVTHKRQQKKTWVPLVLGREA